MKHVTTILCTLCFWAFVAIKVGGTALASWSWWWLLLTPVPMMAMVLGKLGWL